jgi:N-acetylmuramoyl-L-alanine amidase
MQAQPHGGSHSAPAEGQTAVPFDGAPKAPAQTPQQTIHHPSPPEFSVVIDPAHGGTDPGARIAANRLEKDLTLLLAKKLRQELQTRHIAVILLRDSDSDPSFDQRAAAVNLARPSVFITLHAEPGSAIHIYTAASYRLSDSDRDRAGFLPWDNAQAAFQNASQILATTVASSIERRELAALVQPSFLEPLHSIAAPAIAVEAPADKKGFKISPDLIAGALADAIAIQKISAGPRP